MKEDNELRLQALEVKVRHMAQEMEIMIKQYEESQRVLGDLINQYSEPSIEDDTWFSIAGLPEDMKSAAEAILTEARSKGGK